MMQREFEELTGVIVSNSEYASIEKEYASDDGMPVLKFQIEKMERSHEYDGSSVQKTKKSL